jgi:hypothetical protein
MKPLKFGLIAALAVAAMAPVAATSKDAVSEKARQQGMAEAPAAAQAAGVTCQIADARFIAQDGKSKNKFYEIDCAQGLGFVIEAGADKSTAFDCISTSTPEGGKASPLACALPGNANSKADLGALVQKGGVACTVDKARTIGASPSNSFFEVLCNGGAGYIVQAGSPPTADKPVQATPCVAYDEAGGNISCTLSDKAARLAVIDRYATEANNGCQVKDRRYILSAKSGDTYYEASCQNGKGYVYKVDATGKLAQTLDCASADHIGGGCTLTDTRAAKSEQAALYTRLSKAQGFDCDVESYANLPAQTAGQDVVEMVCKNGKPGGIGVFTASGGSVYDCSRALIAGYRCSLNKGAPTAGLTADLKKLGKGSCTVKESRLVGKAASGSTYVEVNCSDGLAGYMIEYTNPTAPKEAVGCAFAKGIAGGCKLTGNTGA